MLRAGSGPDRFLRQERYNYMKAGQLLMKDCEVVCVAADAVSVGNDRILNVFLWNNVANKAFHCPSQVLASVLDVFLSEMSEFPQGERRHMPESATNAGSVSPPHMPSLNGPGTYVGSVSPFCGQNHLKKNDWHLSDICRKCTHAGSVSPFSPDQKGKSLRPICRKCLSKGSRNTYAGSLSVFRPTKRKKPTAHICRKCLSATCTGSVSPNPIFGDVFFISKKIDFGHFSTSKMASGKALLYREPNLEASKPGAPLCVRLKSGRRLQILPFRSLPRPEA